MTDPVRELKSRAELLQRRLQRGEPAALARLRRLPELRRADAQARAAFAAGARRRECLSLLSAELGFSSWPAAKRTLEGAPDAEEYGDLLCPPRCAGHFNAWFARYQDAAALRLEKHGYLLGFRRQFLVVDRLYLETLGLDPDDPDWAALGRDWARPRQPAARSRLYARLIAALPRERPAQSA